MGDSNVNQENSGSVNETISTEGKGKNVANKAKKARKIGKTLMSKVKKMKLLAPIITAVSSIGISLPIILLIILFIGLYLSLPEFSMEKILEFCEGFWDWLIDSETIEVEENQLIDLAQYIEDLGYDLIGCGFATESQITRDENNNSITGVETKKTVDGTPNYLYSYILANERTYTLRGGASSVFSDILTILPLVGNIWDKGEEWVRNQFYEDNMEEYGMLYFPRDVLSRDWWNSAHEFKPTIDRESKTLKIAAYRYGGFVTDTWSWDLDGWTGRYGKPIELSLALHLSTMAPDFVYNFCMDSDLQTEVELDAHEIEYSVEYIYTPNDNPDKKITKSQIEGEMEKLKSDMSVNDSYDSIFSESVSNYPYDISDKQRFIPTIDMIDNTNILMVKEITDSDSPDIEDMLLWKAIDKEENIIRAFNEDGTPIKYDLELTSSGKITFEQNPDGDTQISDLYSGKDIEVSNKYYIVEIGSYSFNDMITKLSNKEMDEVTYNIIWNLFLEKASQSSYNKKYGGLDDFFTAFDECISYVKTESSEEFAWSLDSSGYDTYTQYYNEKISKALKDSVSDHLSSGYKYFKNRVNKNDFDKTCEQLVELLKEMQGYIKADADIIKENVDKIMEPRIAERNSLGLDADTFTLLYQVMCRQETEVLTFKPYISTVTHHWFEDVYFENKGNKFSEFDKVYDFTQVVEDQTKEYNPEGLANSEDIESLKASGKITYTLNGIGENNTDVVQIAQPYTINTEPWHNKVKNWLTNGYFFVYDTTSETAKEIESARKVLKDAGYDSKDPLLGKYDSNEKTLVDKDGNIIDQDIVDDIDQRAKELNEILASTEYKDGKKYKVRLQRINFAKKSSLAAFSILEGVHTDDGEYVYRQLKEFLVELGYFSEEDFELIETNVLEWIIPDYKPQDWPAPKYEKINDEYGVYILSKTEVDKIKAEEIANNESQEESIDLEGFSPGLSVICPEDAVVENVTENYIQLRFTADNRVKNMTMKIDGIEASVGNGDHLSKGEQIGITTEKSIKIMMRDRKKAMINNIEDYMGTEEEDSSIVSIKNGEKIDIPEGLGSVHSYMGWQTITSPSSNQYKLREVAGMNFDDEGFGIIDGRYVIACTSTYGEVGDYVDFYQEDGTIIECIIGDIKNQNDKGCNEWGHLNGTCIVEFVVDKNTWYSIEKGGQASSMHVNPGNASCHPEWNQNITKAVNGGNYFDMHNSDS